MRPDASVVIATQNRPKGLNVVLAALDAQDHLEPFEIVVVDDASDPPLLQAALESTHPLRLLRGRGQGPGAARNLGIAHASADVVIFTDDDTTPSPGWVRATLGHLKRNPAHAGVEGPITSRPWDPLYEYSICGAYPGLYWTANIAYRRDALIEVGGFREKVFRRAHAEDRDLGFRIATLAPIGFCDDMILAHTPRRTTVRDAYRRGRWSESDMLLERLHPEHFQWDNPVPSRFRALASWLRWVWRQCTESRDERPRSPRRLVRTIGVAAARLAGILVAMVAFDSREVDAIRRSEGGDDVGGDPPTAA